MELLNEHLMTIILAGFAAATFLMRAFAQVQVAMKRVPLPRKEFLNRSLEL